MGVPPPQVADLFALKGDAIDNIPGAPGIGEKGARDLIERFGSVEAAMEHAAEVERKMYRESLQNNVERIRMSKRLATIDTAVPIEFALDACRRRSEPTRMPLKADLQRAGVPQPAAGARPQRGYAAPAITRRSRQRLPRSYTGGDSGRCAGCGGDCRSGGEESWRSPPRRYGRSWRGARAKRGCSALRGDPAPFLEDAGAPEDRLRREVGACWRLAAWASRRADSTTT